LFFLMLRIKKKIKKYRKIGNLPWRCCLCRYAGSSALAARNDPMFARPSSCPSAPPCPRHFFLSIMAKKKKTSGALSAAWPYARRNDANGMHRTCVADLVLCEKESRRAAVQHPGGIAGKAVK